MCEVLPFTFMYLSFALERVGVLFTRADRSQRVALSLRPLARERLSL